LNDRQEVLVPANGDAVFRNAAEARQYAFVERLRYLVDILYRLRTLSAERTGPVVRKRFDLQTVDADNAESFVKQIMRERVAGRPKAAHQNVLARIRKLIRPTAIQRIPTREQAVDLKAVGKLENIGQN